MRMRKLVFILLLALPFSVFALPPDVDENSWYTAPVSAFVDQGYLSSSTPFRPSDKATRGEFIELIVSLLGGVKHSPFSGQSFDDVPVNHSSYEAFEEAGIQGWMKGAGSCYGSHPCNGNPNQLINRAEAAALLMRAFGLQETENVPSFDDNAPNQWFTSHIKGAASLCVLRGDEGAKRVRPSDNMNRAEMIVMLSRTMQRENYPNCSSEVKNLTLPKFNKVQAKAKTDIQESNSDEVKIIRALHEIGIDTFNKITNKAKQYEGSARQELQEIVETYGRKVKEFEKLISLSLDHKLTTTEIAKMNILAGEMGALVDQFNKAAASAKQNNPNLKDHQIMMETVELHQQEIYNKMENAQIYDTATSIEMMKVVTDENQILTGLKDLADVAKIRALTDADVRRFNDLIKEFEITGSRFINLMSGGRIDLQKLESYCTISKEYTDFWYKMCNDIPLQGSYETPQNNTAPYQPSVSAPQVDCARERRIGNQQGIASDSNWLNYMSKIGC